MSKELEAVWQVEMDLLEQLLDVCKRYGLRCWVDGGTMLGAVRHKGFIPWDDDIDVSMMRDDYDKLLEIAPKEFKYPYFYQTAYTDVDYYRGHAQLRNSDTAAIRPSNCFEPFNQGIFIDIFPMDGVPVDKVKLQSVLKANRRTLRFLKAKNLNILYSGRLGQVFRKIKARKAVKRYGWVSLFKATEDRLRDTPVSESDVIGELAFSGSDLLFSRHLFDKTVWLDFEDMKVPVPAAYDAFLRNQYGDDYMTPMENPSMHGELILDTEHSYRELLPKVRHDYRCSLFKRLLRKIES